MTNPDHTLQGIYPVPSGWRAMCTCGRAFRGPDETAARLAWRYHREHPDAAGTVVDALNPDAVADFVGEDPDGAEQHAGFAALRQPFEPELVGQLPRGRVTIDFVGHGATTARLLDVDPLWNWEPCAWVGDPKNGVPRFELSPDPDDPAEFVPVGLWIRLTVLGVTRLGFGSCPPNQFDPEKVLIGDALRNAAMRFGVALDLWVKGRTPDSEQHSHGAETPHQQARPTISKSHKEKVDRIVAAATADAEYKAWCREQFPGKKPVELSSSQLAKALRKLDEPEDVPEPEVEVEVEPWSLQTTPHMFEADPGAPDTCIACGHVQDAPMHYRDGEEPFRMLLGVDRPEVYM